MDKNIRISTICSPDRSPIRPSLRSPILMAIFVAVFLATAVWIFPAPVHAADTDLSGVTFSVKAKVSGPDTKVYWTKPDAYGKGFAKGICDYLGLEYTD